MTRPVQATLLTSNLLALPLFVVGLTSPLTPSEGVPSLVELSIFAGLPFAVVLVTSFVVRNRALRTLLLLEAVSIAGFTAWLLKLQVCT
jgi:hypothetical protein